MTPLKILKKTLEHQYLHSLNEFLLQFKEIKAKVMFVATCSTVDFERKGVAISFPTTERHCSKLRKGKKSTVSIDKLN